MIYLPFGDTSCDNLFVENIKLSIQRVISYYLICILRATSHMRLRARDHYASSTLIGGKGGAGPSSLHTSLEGPTEYVNARWM
jgi:hypothetical protein